MHAIQSFPPETPQNKQKEIIKNPKCMTFMPMSTCKRLTTTVCKGYEG